MKMYGMILGLVIIVAASTGVFLAMQGNLTKEEYHIHIDFKVYLDGEQFNFLKQEYMTSKDKAISGLVHLHDGDGEVIHFHDKDINLGFFFESLGMGFNESCFLDDSFNAYCNDGDKTLKMYVNGQRNFEFGEYIPNDLDRILITYGTGTDADPQEIASVTDKACIHSGSCPERGRPSVEEFGGGSCVSGDECEI